MYSNIILFIYKFEARKPDSLTTRTQQTLLALSDGVFFSVPRNAVAAFSRARYRTRFEHAQVVDQGSFHSKLGWCRNIVLSGI